MIINNDIYKKIIIWPLLLLLSWSLHAQSWPSSCPDMQKNSYSLHELAKIWHQAPQHPMHKRLEIISKHFLYRPYQRYVLGEGLDGDIDQCSLWRLDAFDCETYVTTVLALALTSTPQSYEACFKALRYHDGQVNFKSRHHFTGLDWNHDNQQRGILRDVTRSILDPKGRTVFLMSKTKINKAAWFAHLPLERVRLQVLSESIQKNHKNKLMSDTQHILPQLSEVPYIPLSVLFDQHQQPNMHIFKQIPDGSIIEIVRPNWELKDTIGTNLDISHLGFVFYKHGKSWFRNASSIEHQVTDIPLIDYLKQALNSPTIRGINIQVVSINAPSDHGC